jgi:methyl-accepting chemotaxis protein-1 (serine sensor receptor)
MRGAVARKREFYSPSLRPSPSPGGDETNNCARLVPQMPPWSTRQNGVIHETCFIECRATMKTTRPMTVSRRLGLAFSLLVLLAVAVAAVGAWGLGKSQQAMQGIYADRTLPLEQLGAMHYQITRSRVLLMDAIMQASPESAERRVKQYQETRAKAAENWKLYMATTLTDEERVLAAEVAKAHGTLVEQGLDATAAALTAGRYGEAKQLLDQKISRLNPAFTETMEKLLALQVRVADQDFQASQATTSRLTWAMCTLVLLALAAGLVLGIFITRGLTRLLGAEPGELAGVAQRIADGALVDDGAARAPAGSVLASMQAMRESLVTVVGNVRLGVESVATASAEIAQGNADLSSRTEQQASSLQQTAASMEQLTGTVRTSTANARQANELAQGATEVASRGGEAMAQVVRTMNDIQSASTKISEITGVIDGIAFQTNILALNAAVEAARAGEQGRGFAVVASEVRTLAQRSAEAARQIKALIGDSVTQVEAGGVLVQDAGRTMDEVVKQVRQVGDLIGAITAAAGEQSQGIDQVGQAVSQLDQATQQNAALVEESAAAAESLKAQA